MGQRATICLLSDECIYAYVSESKGRRREITRHGKAKFRLPDSLLLDHDPDELADAIRRAIEDNGTSTSSITLILPLQWCLTQCLATSQKRTTPEALAYEFERYLPVALEEVTCAFARGANGSVLAVAIPTAPMANLISSLSRHGIEVNHIVVDVLAVAQGMRTTNTTSGTLILDSRWGRMATEIKETEQVVTAVFGLENRHDVAGTLAEELQRRGVSDGYTPEHWSILDFGHRGRQPAICKALGCDEARVTYLSSTDALESVVTAAVSAPPDLELRTGSLAGRGEWDQVVKLVEHCIGCALAVALIWIGGMYLSTRALRKQLTTVESAQLETYNQVFDSETLPPGAAMRLASERIRLQGVTRTQDPLAGETPAVVAKPLDVLRNCVAMLPEYIRVMLLDARIDGNRLTLRGQTAEHRDAERIVEAINTIPGLHARQPRTSRLETGGVEFSITADVDDER